VPEQILSQPATVPEEVSIITVAPRSWHILSIVSELKSVDLQTGLVGKAYQNAFQNGSPNLCLRQSLCFDTNHLLNPCPRLCNSAFRGLGFSLR
jgi:hypothetical protein